MKVGLQFAETMRGQLSPVTGAVPQAMEFRAHVACPSLLGMLLSGPMPLTGRMDIEGLVSDAPTTGSIELDLLGCQRVVYDLAWCDAEGVHGRFYGWKSLRIRHPLRSCTELSGTVVQSGQLVGHGLLHFDLADLPSFLRSMRPRVG